MSAGTITRITRLARAILSTVFAVLMVRAIVTGDWSALPWIVTTVAVALTVIVIEAAVEVITEEDRR